MRDNTVRGRVGLAIVCQYEDAIRAELESDGAGDAAPLQRVLDAAAGEGDLEGALDALHAALQCAGDPQGLRGYGDHDGGTRGVTPVGIDDGPVDFVHLCPRDRCAGRPWTFGSGEQRCVIDDRPLRLKRI